MPRDKRKIQSAKFDMTPMIDVTFQLIIFFILIMQTSQIDIRNVQLPMSLNTTDDITKKKKIYVCHLFHKQGGAENTYKADLDVNGWHITVPRSNQEFHKVDDLAARITEEANQFAAKGNPPNERGNSEMELLVRGDMRAPSHYFAVVLAACIKARVYKVKVSVLAPRKPN